MKSFLSFFYDAKFVVTDSFHACVFSIIFRKPFCVIDSLLKMFSLEDRMVASPDDILHLCNIDYDEVHKKLEKYKREALRPAFLTDNWSWNSQTKGKIRLISTGCSTLYGKGLI